MKRICTIISLIMIAALIYVTYKNPRNNSKKEKSITMLMHMVIIAVLGYSLIFLTDNYTVMSLAISIYFAANAWICYMILLLSLNYATDGNRGQAALGKGAQIFIKAILLADTISLLLNVFFEHVVEYEYIYFSGEAFIKYSAAPLYIGHLAICYSLFGMAAIISIKKLITVPKIYRIKYGVVMAVLLAVAGINAICTLQFCPVDISIYTYATAAILINIYTTAYIPNSVVQYMQSLVFDERKDLIFMFDNGNNCRYMNKRAKTVLGADIVQKQDLEGRLQKYNAKNGNITIGDNGEIREYQIKSGDITDAAGGRLGCYYNICDITKEQKLRERYQYVATHDSLTGLYNRDYFMERAEYFMKQDPETTYLIICSNLRQFKAINEIFGEEIGDRVLLAIADKLKEDDDGDRVYGRIGSDNFALCVPKENFSVESYLQKSKSAIGIANSDCMIVNHIGVYEVESPDIPVSVMCDRANMAINSIKDDMQREVAYYNDDLRKEILREQEVFQDLPEAFEEKQFTVFLQPQFSHSTGAIVGAETLVRWRHPEKGLIPPYIFIPLMESSGLISRLDRYVWRMACELLHKWTTENPEKYSDLSISVNISPKDFFYLDLYDEFMSLTKEFDIEPRRLKLEITEGAVMQDVPKQVALIKKLQEEGFVVEMDDFGSGFSSLNTLKDIPVDILKMDMKFMENSENTKRSADILQTVIAMADKLSMPVIAEGVEHLEQADFLESIGCDIIQGYYYSKPVPVEDFEKMLSQYPYKELSRNNF